MASSREIPAELWEAHKEIILRLRFQENLQLDGTNTDRRGIMQVMRDEHQFQATISQYEAQLKKWQASKNLKKRDWEAILPVYDDLKGRGLEPRVRLGDHVLDESRVKRARRYVKQGGDTFGQNVVGLVAGSSQTRGWYLEIRQPGGQYTEYSVDHHGEIDIPEVPLSSTLTRRNSESNLFNITSQPPQADLGWMPDSLLFASMLSPQLDSFPLTITSPQRNQENVGEAFDSVLPQEMPADLWFLDSGVLSPAGLGVSAIHNPFQNISPGPLEPQWTLSKECIESMLQSIPQVPASRGVTHETLAQEISEKMESLLNDDFFDECQGDGFELISRVTTSMSELHKRIIFSIVNNFAGLSSVSPPIILRMLRIDPEMISCLVVGLRSTDLTIAKPLADSLFRIAIEAGDEEAVDIILKTTSGRRNEIYPDLFVCQFQGISYTPIALASRLGHFGVVEKLLGVGARVCVESNSDLGCCALTEVVLWGGSSAIRKDVAQSKPQAIQVVRLLLDNGARVSVNLLQCALMTQSSELVEMLVQAVPRERHCELFQPGMGHTSILCHVAEKLEGPLANKIVRNLITTCHAMNCTPSCAAKYSPTSERLLVQAILKGNAELIEYLLEHIQPTYRHLTAAIHSKRLEMIDTLLTQGICVLGKALCFGNMSSLYENCAKAQHHRGSHKPTTPLAEVIRMRNPELIKRLEYCGALDNIHDPSTLEFEAAASATVEVGDLSYLKQLLTLAPPAHESHQNNLIMEAIEAGHTEIAATLIIHNVNFWMPRQLTGYQFEDLLYTALKKRNQEIVETLLEYVDSGDWILSSRVVNEAIRWGNISILEDLLQMGWLPSRVTHGQENWLFSWGPSPEVDEAGSPLGVAIACGNAEIADLLLKWGSNPSELTAAIRVGDERMFRLLLHHGADPADETALSAALHSRNRLLLPALLRAFSSRYPDGKKGFGITALETAIRSRDALALDALLKIKLDVNSNGQPNGSSGKLLLLAISQSKESDPGMNQIIYKLLDAGADLERAFDGRTALLTAVAVNNLQTVKLLLSKGVNINRPARRGLKRTALQEACERGSFRMVQLLLDNGADVHARPAVNGGATALQLAAIQGSVKILRLLLDKGADIHGAPAAIRGRTALEGAAEHGRVSVLNILLAEGAAGYSLEEIRSAKAYAEKQGHRGCEERLKLALFRFGDGGGSRALLAL